MMTRKQRTTFKLISAIPMQTIHILWCLMVLIVISGLSPSYGQVDDNPDPYEQLRELLSRWQHHPTGPELSLTELTMDPKVVKPLWVSAADATEDIERLFYLLEYGYCGYGYFSLENSFEAAQAEIINEINSRWFWLRGDLAKLVRRHLDFITDCHMKVGSVPFAGHQDFWFAPELELIERDGAYYFGATDAEQTLVSVNGLDPKSFVFPSLSSAGQAIWCLGLLSPTTPEALTVVFRRNDSIDEQRVGLHRANNKRRKLFERFDLGGIPVVRIRTFSDHHTKQIDGFLRAADELRGEPCVIIDVRGNGGGNTCWPREWITRFTGQMPQLNQTLTELVSRTALVGQSNYQAWLAAGPGKGIRDHLERERDRLALRLNGFDEDGEQPDWSSAYIPKRPLIPNETTLIVIIDREVASSGEGLLSFLQDQVENVVIVGENTRGALVFGHVSAHRLPHSKLLVQLPVKLNVPLDLQWREERGFEPDYWVPAEDALNRAVAAVRAGTIRTVNPLSAEAMSAEFVPERQPRFNRRDFRRVAPVVMVVCFGLVFGIVNRKRGAWIFLVLALFMASWSVLVFANNAAAQYLAIVIACTYGIIAGVKFWRSRISLRKL
jgi:Peptidase family S41